MIWGYVTVKLKSLTVTEVLIQMLHKELNYEFGLYNLFLNTKNIQKIIISNY